MERRTFSLSSTQQAHYVLKNVLWPQMRASLESGQKLQIEIKKETRTTDQNRRMWAMLTDISLQVQWYGRKLTPENWKDVFTAALTKQDVVAGIEGGFVALGKSTSKMTKQEMSDLQELMTAFGAQQGVTFIGTGDSEYE